MLQKFVGPIYLQVYEILKSDILNGRWAIGSALPSEIDLAKDYGVSVGTMRKSLGLLVNESFIQRQRGRGTVVVDRTARRQSSNLAGKLTFKGEVVHIAPQVVEIIRRRPTEEEASALGIRPHAEVHAVNRSVISKAEFRFFETVVVPQELVGDLPDDLTKVVHEDLGQALWDQVPEYSIANVQERIFPMAATDDIARMLETDTGALVLRVTRIAYAEQDIALEYTLRYMQLLDAEYAIEFQAD
ncbi:MAG: GntR family transcriptional regulator [Filomicrobium sp.]